MAENADVGPVDVDALVDGALAAISEDAQAPAPKGRGGAPAPAPEPEEPEDDDEPEEPSDPDEEAGDQALEGEEETEPAGEDDATTDFGTKDNPIRFKDLPDDRYIKIKVDGEEEVLSLKEALRSGIRESTFHKQIERVKESERNASEIAERAIEWQKEQAAQLQRAFGSPDELLSFFSSSDEREQVFLEAAQKFAARLKAEKERPELRIHRLTERQQGVLRAERERLENERRTTDNIRRSAEMQRALEPGFIAGLREAGLPKMTPELGRMAKAILTANVVGRALTAEDVRAAVVQGAKVLGLKPASQEKPKPKPVTVTPRAPKREEGQSKGQKPPPRGTVESVLFGLKPRRF